MSPISLCIPTCAFSNTRRVLDRHLSVVDVRRFAGHQVEGHVAILRLDRLLEHFDDFLRRYPGQLVGEDTGEQIRPKVDDLDDNLALVLVLVHHRICVG